MQRWVQIHKQMVFFEFCYSRPSHGNSGMLPTLCTLVVHSVFLQWMDPKCWEFRCRGHSFEVFYSSETSPCDWWNHCHTAHRDKSILQQKNILLGSWWPASTHQFAVQSLVWVQEYSRYALFRESELALTTSHCHWPIITDHECCSCFSRSLATTI